MQDSGLFPFSRRAPNRVSSVLQSRHCGAASVARTDSLPTYTPLHSGDNIHHHNTRVGPALASRAVGSLSLFEGRTMIRLQLPSEHSLTSAANPLTESWPTNTVSPTVATCGIDRMGKSLAAHLVIGHHLVCENECAFSWIMPGSPGRWRSTRQSDRDPNALLRMDLRRDMQVRREGGRKRTRGPGVSSRSIRLVFSRCFCP
jgi:hypothetical protein